MNKYTEVADFIRKRVSKGDYSLRGVPAERLLAAEIGVSYMTVRRAIHALITDGTLIRQSNGRVAVGLLTQGNGSQLQLAFLAPTFNSPVIEQWRVALDAIVRKRGGVVRPILYMHWDDPIVQDALEAFDGVFLIPVPEPLPAHVESRLRTAKRLVVLDQDYSHMGIPSVRLFPPVFVQRLLDHLEKLGHRRIDCLNLHPEDPEANPVYQQRVEQWKVWKAAHGLDGQLVNVPQPLHGAPFNSAYAAIKKLLDAGTFKATALLCVTAPGAIGAMRALHEHGMTPGREVSVCAIDGESMGDTLIPSLTALEPPSALPYLSVCVEWIVEGGQAWSGPLLLQPAEIPLVIRESTGKPLSRHSSAKRAKPHA